VQCCRVPPVCIDLGCSPSINKDSILLELVRMECHDPSGSARFNQGGEQEMLSADDLAAAELASNFLQSMIFGVSGKDSCALGGILSCIDLHGLARCSMLCNRGRELVSIEQVWKPRVAKLCTLWKLPVPSAARGGLWRQSFFQPLRPRCDGLYVGECRYVHYIRPGASTDKKVVNKSYHWVEYRRFVRFLPPDPADGACFALVLRDACGFRTAVDVLTNIDPRAHSKACCSAQDSLDTWNTDVKLRVMGGTYILNGSRIEIRCAQYGKQYLLALELGHGGDRYFSDRLIWKEYLMVNNNSEIIPFNLGRSSRGDGEPANFEKDHFAAMLLRPCRPLEWLA